MADVKPNHTIYINNLNEKTKKDGKRSYKSGFKNFVRNCANFFVTIWTFIYCYKNKLSKNYSLPGDICFMVNMRSLF